MVTYKEENHHVELYFDEGPEKQIKAAFLMHEWIWNEQKQCWSAPINEENVLLATTIRDLANRKSVDDVPENRIMFDENSLLLRIEGEKCDLGHELKRVNGQVDICDEKGVVRAYYFPAEYCDQCGLYFIHEDAYARLKSEGCILCKIMKCADYREQGVPAGKQEQASVMELESLLHVLGYNVKPKYGYDSVTISSDVQRRVILERAAEKNVMSKDQEITCLDYFYRYYESAEGRDHWKEDLNYLEANIPCSHDNNAKVSVINLFLKDDFKSSIPKKFYAKRIFIIDNFKCVKWEERNHTVCEQWQWTIGSSNYCTDENACGIYCNETCRIGFPVSNHHENISFKSLPVAIAKEMINKFMYEQFEDVLEFL